MPATVAVLRKGGEAARPPLSISAAHEGEKEFRRELLVGTSGGNIFALCERRCFERTCGAAALLLLDGLI